MNEVLYNPNLFSRLAFRFAAGISQKGLDVMAEFDKGPNSNKQFWYPELAKIFKRELEGRQERDKREESTRQEFGSISQLQEKYAKYAKGSAEGKTSVFNYVKGFRKPSQLFITWFLRDVVRGTQREFKELEAEIANASKVKEPYPKDTLLGNFASGNSVLTFTSVDYYPFAGHDECFVESVFSHFFELADIKAQKIGNRRGPKPEEGYVAFGRYETAERMLRGLKFWRMPIRMSLGSICLPQHRDQRDLIASVLAKLSDRSAVPLQPIVVANDVGSMHCRKTLGFVTGPPDLPNLDVKELSDSLLRHTGGHFIPVICTDEYTVLRVLGMLRARGQDGCLVFPLNSRRTIRDETDDTRRELPQYYLSIAVSRNDHEFEAFMHDALVQFLSTEIESTATAWYLMAKKLAAEVSGILRALPASDNVSQETLRQNAARDAKETWEWIFYVLTLDLESIESFSATSTLPWTPILLRARRRIQRDLGEHETLIDDLVSEAFSHDEPEDRLHQIDRICNAFDIQLPAGDRYIGKSELIDSLKRELRGAPPPLPMKIDVYDPLLDNTTARVASRGMRSFMRELQNMYDDTSETTVEGHGKDAVVILGEEIAALQNRNTKFGGEEGCILLGRTGIAQEDFISGACLCDLNSNECELRYLWVHPYYRGRRVGHRIIGRAKEVAEKHGCTSIKATVLKDALKRAAKTFIEMGFVESGMTDDMRTLFRCPIYPDRR
jgi:GNAT superfamily N-acetyltransferase